MQLRLSVNHIELCKRVADNSTMHYVHMFPALRCRKHSKDVTLTLQCNFHIISELLMALLTKSLHCFCLIAFFHMPLFHCYADVMS